MYCEDAPRTGAASSQASHNESRYLREIPYAYLVEWTQSHAASKYMSAVQGQESTRQVVDKARAGHVRYTHEHILLHVRQPECMYVYTYIYVCRYKSHVKSDVHDATVTME